MGEFFDLYPWALPIAIFFGRIGDVSLGTLRIIFVSKGEKKIAPMIGFVEVLIWVVIISQVLTKTSGPLNYIAFAGGYAAGTFVGLFIEQRIGFGFIAYRVFTAKNGSELVNILNKHGYGSTVMQGQGSVAEINIIEAVISRKDGKKVERIIVEYDPNAFYLVEDVRGKQRGIFVKR